MFNFILQAVVALGLLIAGVCIFTGKMGLPGKPEHLRISGSILIFVGVLQVITLILGLIFTLHAVLVFIVYAVIVFALIFTLAQARRNKKNIF